MEEHKDIKFIETETFKKARKLKNRRLYRTGLKNREECKCSSNIRRI